jgi:hypothetical protein
MSLLNPLKYANLALAFLLELCALAALAYWGFNTGSGELIHLILGIGAPLLTAVVWGMFVAPRAVKPAAPPAKLALRLIVFGAAALGLAAAGQSTLAVIFAVLVAINLTLIYAWRQDAVIGPDPRTAA